MSKRTQYRIPRTQGGPNRGTKRGRELTPIEKSLKFPRRTEEGNQTVCVFPRSLLAPQQKDFDSARKAINNNLVSKQKIFFSLLDLHSNLAIMKIFDYNISLSHITYLQPKTNDSYISAQQQAGFGWFS